MLRCLIALLMSWLLARPAAATELPKDDATELRTWLAWQAHQAPKQRVGEPHPEDAWRFLAEIHAELRPWVEARPDVIQPFRIGETVQGRPIWAFRVTDPGAPVRHKVLVEAQIHAMEWIGAEVACELLLTLAQSPVPGVEYIVIPVLNVDGRRAVEKDLRAGRDQFRRSNANGVDLNRDFTSNRTPHALWAKVMKKRYRMPPGDGLTQPETIALDALATREGFDVTVSLHAFGGYIYYPWAGLWERPPDHDTLHAMGQVMADGMGGHSYQVKQLSRWAFFFRGHGMSLDHFYERHGAKAYLIEFTRSGWTWRPSTWRSDFRMYNPADPDKHTDLGVRALRALGDHLSTQPDGGSGQAVPNRGTTD